MVTVGCIIQFQALGLCVLVMGVVCGKLGWSGWWGLPVGVVVWVVGMGVYIGVLAVCEWVWKKVRRMKLEVKR